MSFKFTQIQPIYRPNDFIIREYSDTASWSFRSENLETHRWLPWVCTGNDIKNGDKYQYGDGIPASEYENWKKCIVDWINENNHRVYENKFENFEITFKFSDCDEDFAYTYERYVDGKLMGSGKGWLKDWNTEVEKQAWRKAVREYKKVNNIETESEKRKKKKEKTKQNIKNLDSPLPKKEDAIPPTLLSAIEKFESDPCEFISEVIQKGTSVVTGLSPKELINYYTKVYKKNIAVASNIASNAQTSIVEQFYMPVENALDSMDEYFEQLDTDREEWIKQHSNDVCLFEVIAYERKVSTPPTPKKTTSNTSGGTKSGSGGGTKDYTTSGSGGGTFEWAKKEPNENVITKRGELWSIISKDLGKTPTSSQANASMTTIKVKTRNEDGVMMMRDIRVHKAAVGTVRKIFEEIYNTTNFKIISKTKWQLGGFNHRFVRGSTTTLSQHSFGSAIDLNPVVNPMKGSKSKDVEKQTDANNNDKEMRTVNHKVVKIMAKYGYGWGGCYSDYMHFSCKTYTKANGWFSGC